MATTEVTNKRKLADEKRDDSAITRQPLPGREEEADRYDSVRQYSLAQILAVWAAAALPMAILSWIVAPRLADTFSGAGGVPMMKALLICITGGLVWQFVLVLALVGREQGNVRWSTLRESLWLRSPRSPRNGRIGGRLWLLVIPLILHLLVEELLPTFSHADDRDMGVFLDSDIGQAFLSGNWGWYSLHPRR